MTDFGIYRFTYQPPDISPREPHIEMTISSEGTLTEMLSAFQGFLQASGYVIDGKRLALVDEETTPQAFGDFLSDGTDPLTGISERVYTNTVSLG